MLGSTSLLLINQVININIVFQVYLEKPMFIVVI